MSQAARLASAPRPGLPSGFLFRLGPDDEAVAAALRPGDVSGVIIAAKHLVPYTSDDPRSKNHTGDELLTTARHRGLPVVVDPATAALTDMNPLRPVGRRQFGTPVAAALASSNLLPLSPQTALATGQAARIAGLSALMQGSSVVLSAPYLRVHAPDDPWRTVNERLVAETLALADGRPVAAWIEVPLEALRAGLVTAIVESLPRVEYLFLRVAGLQPRRASVDDARAVLATVAALAADERRPVLDAVGSLGVAAFAVGAHAFTGGFPRFRWVPEKTNQGGGPARKGPSVLYEEPFGWREQSGKTASTAPACPDSRCPGPSGSSVELRAHAAHLSESYAKWVRAVGPAELVAALFDGGGPGAQAWARALAEFDSAAQSIHSPR